jgi:hypothetical protein
LRKFGAPNIFISDEEEIGLWKVGLPTFSTAALFFCISSVWTHTVLFDPANPMPRPSLDDGY